MTLKDIGIEMVGQDNRATQYPLFVIQEDGLRPSAPWEDYDSVDISEDGEEGHYKIEPVFDLRAGVFFTTKACQQHIDENDYHYTNPRVYAISAWRNPEMQAVQQHLIVASGKKLPSQYA